MSNDTNFVLDYARGTMKRSPNEVAGAVVWFGLGIAIGWNAFAIAFSPGNLKLSDVLFDTLYYWATGVVILAFVTLLRWDRAHLERRHTVACGLGGLAYGPLFAAALGISVHSNLGLTEKYLSWVFLKMLITFLYPSLCSWLLFRRCGSESTNS